LADLRREKLLENILERVVNYLQKRLRTCEWKIKAFKLCERCEKFWSFDPNACPYKRPFGFDCPLFVEVKRDKKSNFLCKVDDEVIEKPKRREIKSSVQMQHLKDRINWKFCPRCHSTD
jgi:hypothetical protein